MGKPVYLGTSEERIVVAERALNVRFPEPLRQMWKIYNLVELPKGHWRVFPIFDPANPRKTSNDIAYENTKGQHLEPSDVISIAESLSGSGNRLSLKRLGDTLDSAVLLYTYRTGKLTPWRGALDDLLAEARSSAEAVRRLHAEYFARRSIDR